MSYTNHNTISTDGGDIQHSTVRGGDIVKSYPCRCCCKKKKNGIQGIIDAQFAANHIISLSTRLRLMSSVLRSMSYIHQQHNIDLASLKKVLLKILNTKIENQKKKNWRGVKTVMSEYKKQLKPMKDVVRKERKQGRERERVPLDKYRERKVIGVQERDRMYRGYERDISKWEYERDRDNDRVYTQRRTTNKRIKRHNNNKEGIIDYGGSYDALEPRDTSSVSKGAEELEQRSNENVSCYYKDRMHRGYETDRSEYGRDRGRDRRMYRDRGRDSDSDRDRDRERDRDRSRDRRRRMRNRDRKENGYSGGGRYSDRKRSKR